MLFDKSRGLFSMSNWEFDGVKCFANVLSNLASWIVGWCLTGSFLDGLASVEKDGKIGFVNMKGGFGYST